MKIACEIREEDAPKISEPMAVVKDSSEPAAAKRFLRYLDSPAAGKVFAECGFMVRNGTP